MREWNRIKVGKEKEKVGKEKEKEELMKQVKRMVAPLIIC